MAISIRTPIVDLHEYNVAGLSKAMCRGLAASVAGHAAKTDLNDATVEDLLSYFPARYEDRSNFIQIDELYDGLEASVELYTRMAGGYRVGRNRGPRQPPLFIYEVSASDRERTRKPVTIFWFISGKGAASIIEYYNKRFKRGTRFVAFGRWEWDGRRNTFSLKLAKPNELELLPAVAPETLDFEAEIEPDQEPTADENNDELLEDLGSPEFANIHTSRQVPVYRKLGPFQTKRLREIIFAVLNDLDALSVSENLPAETAKRHDLIPRSQALVEIHFPPSDVPIALYERFVSPAQKRLIFDEFFWLSLALQLRRGTRKDEKKGAVIELAKNFRDRVRDILEFKMTGAQKRVFRQIVDDITSDKPMNRLLQGDVGSGKTIVAFLTMFAAAENGYQAALMAPTEILAEQHARNARRLFEPTGYKVSLLTGSMKAAEKRKAQGEIASGESQIVIGTHAIIQEGVSFEKLAVAVIDEQHRFGVRQRGKLQGKALAPHALTMTATPI
ncbi:MAG TPA: DEAD/DEAH box helicase, partial [Pyrinomonadaceae bacterium]|nr:DEAD/DEAH box helicase [Pyrinomonadaceae bacterium]